MKKLKNNKGITLVALVVTIIVLLILAGVALSAVLSQDGIFSRADQATDKYGQAKARETLELALSEAQMQKYESGLTDEQLTEKINKIGEELPERTDPDISQAIVDGYIFEIDRTVPKILDYIGPADGVVITTSVTGNGGWIKPGDIANIRVTGKIKTYSGGTITEATATKGETTTNLSLDAEGGYTIDNITTDTTIVIYAKDSNNKDNSKKIPITIRIDDIPPVLDSIDVKTEGLKIIINATGHDNESGLKHFKYEISSTEDTTLEGIPADKKEGTFTPGQKVEIKTTETGDRDETKYTVKIIVIDNCDNESTEKTKDITLADELTVEEAKKLVTSTSALQENIGRRVKYKDGEKWQIFYYDEAGDFGPAKTLYLKKGSPSNVIETLTVSTKTAETDPAVSMMRRMNPKWRDAEWSEVDGDNEKVCVWLCDPEVWNSERNEEYSSFAIGSPSLEMYMKAYNVWKQNNPNGTVLIYDVKHSAGYSVGVNNQYESLSYQTYHTQYKIEEGPGSVFLNGNCSIWIASPSIGTFGHPTEVFYAREPGQIQNRSTSNTFNISVFPVVPLDL